MRVLPPVEEEIRRVVRDARAKDPLISVSGLERALEEHFKRGFSHQYVSKIADKVAREGLIEVDRTKIEERLQFTRENYRMMRERLLEIIYWKPPEVIDDLRKIRPPLNKDVWPAPGSEDTELGVLMEPEVGHGEAEVYAGVQT